MILALFIRGPQAGAAFSDYILAFVISAALFSILSLAIPHAWAKYAGEKVFAKSYRLLFLIVKLNWSVTHLWMVVDLFVRRLAGVADTTPEEALEDKQEEFLSDLEQQRADGVVDEEEQEMIENVLELSESTADEIMTPRTDVIAINVQSNLQTVVNTINEAGHSRLPVYEENIDNIIGFIYAKDMLEHIGKDTSDFELRKKMRKAYFVPETKPLRNLLHEFQNKKLHVAVVLDEYGGTAGIVTLEDILEELVGEITDEYEDHDPEPIRQVAPDTIEIDARMYICDLNDEFEVELPEEEDYDTVGGFVFSHLGYIPKAGTGFDYKGLHFDIVSAEARRILNIQIRKAGRENAQN